MRGLRPSSNVVSTKDTDLRVSDYAGETTDFAVFIIAWVKFGRLWVNRRPLWTPSSEGTSFRVHRPWGDVPGYVEIGVLPTRRGGCSQFTYGRYAAWSTQLFTPYYYLFLYFARFYVVADVGVADGGLCWFEG